MNDLAKKLGIKSGHVVYLLEATPRPPRCSVRPARPGRGSTIAPIRAGAILMFWPSQLDGLAELFARLQYQIVPAGAIWAVIPKKPFARARGSNSVGRSCRRPGCGPTWSRTVVSLGDQEYATRFVIRKERRNDYA